MVIPLFMGLMALFRPLDSPDISCDCPDLPSKENLTEKQYDSILIRQAFDRADVVFFAEVTGFEERSGSMFQASLEDESWDVPKEKRFGISPTLTLKKAYKGSKKFYKNVDLRISQRWRVCDMYFNKDAHYVFFGQIDKDGQVRTNICYPNRMIRIDDQLKQVETWIK